MIEITSGDFLAGGGGVTEAMTQVPGLRVKWVLNHWSTAIRTNMHNHKNVKHYLADFYKQDEHEMESVDFVWASIECTQHSRANGGREKKIGSYTLGFELVRYLKHLQPLIVGIENVPEFKKWSPVRIKEDVKNSTNSYSALSIDKKGQYKYVPIKSRLGECFREWKAAICSMGYDYHELICNAADYGIPTRRVRYFAFFTKSHLQMEVNWPKPTHSKDGKNGLLKWVACKSFIDLSNEGESIFGREFNENIKPQYRKPPVVNSMKRYAGGCKKYFPELAFICQYYGSGLNIQSIDSPLNTITTKDRHVLVKMEKLNFITDHCHTDNYHTPDVPMNPILTRETKQLVTGSFISHQFGNSVNHSVNSPMGTITAGEKIQFVTTYFNANENKPLLSAIANGEFDFDIKARFLTPDELSNISTFPAQYFTDPKLKLTKKEMVKLIGNAVPPKWAELMIKPVIAELQQKLEKQQAS